MGSGHTWVIVLVFVAYKNSFYDGGWHGRRRYPLAYLHEMGDRGSTCQ